MSAESNRPDNPKTPEATDHAPDEPKTPEATDHAPPDEPQTPEATDHAPDEPQTPEEIRAKIERTQQELGDTVEALAYKTDVKAQASARIDAAAETVRDAVNDVKDSVHETADQAAAKLRQATPESASAGAQQVSATVQDKPLPFATGGAFVAGVLVGWLLGEAMTVDKVMFTPISVGSGLIAGFIGRKLFTIVWGLVDDEEAPKAEHRRVAPLKLVAALAVEGMLFSLIRGMVDHGARHAYLRLTGEWPGDEEPQAE